MVFEIVKSLLFYMDTRVRTGGTIGAPQFSFPNNLIGLKPQDGENIRLTLQEASIEYTFFQTEDYNNAFLVIEEVDTVGVINRIITLDIGNYNLVTLIVELTIKLNAGSLFTWVVTYLPATNRLTFHATYTGPDVASAPIFNFDRELVKAITGIDIFESANELLGFPFDAVVTLTLNNPPGNSWSCTSVVPVTTSPGVSNLYLTIENSCSNYGNANVALAHGNADLLNSFSPSNILGKIPISNPPFSTIYFFDINSNFSTIISNKYLDNLNLTLYNERFTVIEPRKDWTFTIKVEIVRPKTEAATTEGIREMLKLNQLKFALKHSGKNGKPEPPKDQDQEAEGDQEVQPEGDPEEEAVAEPKYPEPLSRPHDTGLPEYPVPTIDGALGWEGTAPETHTEIGGGISSKKERNKIG